MWLTLPPKGLQLVSAERKEIPVLGCTTLPVCLADLKVNHNFVVVQSLISPVILGIDFVQWHNLVLDFTTSPVSIVSKQNKSDMKPSLPRSIKPLLNAAKVCATGVSGESEDIIGNCAIPLFGKSTPTFVGIPKCVNLLMLGVLEQHKNLFRQIIGQTQLAKHFIPNGMEPDPEKIAAVRDWSIPCNVNELRSFLGLASYYRRYIRRFSDIATAVHALTNKGDAFVWTSECQVAFDSLKEILTGVPILAYPSFAHTAHQFQLQTDASATGLGAVLEQGDRVIAYDTHCCREELQRFTKRTFSHNFCFEAVSSLLAWQTLHSPYRSCTVTVVGR